MNQIKTTSINHIDLFPARWHIRNLIICNLLGVILLVSWLWQPTRQWWDAFDLQLFHFLNAPLSSSTIWAKVWAIGNMRPVDIAVGLIMLVTIIKSNWIFDGAHVRRAFYAFFALLLLLLFIRIALFDEVLKLMHWQRSSPSLTVEGAVRLTKLFPGWEAKWYLKDSSKQCFPGDHASVLLIWTAMLAFFARGRQMFLVWLVTFLYLLPRLAAGAHWASDDLVGGLFLSLIAFGWGFYTPYMAKVQDLFERITAPMMRCLAKLPYLRNISFISGQ